ncbi:pantoate--beta-alanine ligase [Streptohalobacillus salinus]|uniref:Pantothenate synthetase n=1 Tax=Streptohalobacillus salinus TaxID=621096 RepID=A0A2V3WBA8_9BACI|nr:pantoate--beta-alanine ligase [Streptohalobacillus salinus]PXW91743.1 pantoate--beta-alanine ligase [Streptohalobacillus salinus]
MEIINSITQMREKVKHHQILGQTVGFVPTMGYLHEGHASLLAAAKKEADIVVLSVFVNPLQFGENEDLDNYPRDEKRDQTIAQKNGVDYLFMPAIDRMYPTEMGIHLSINQRVGVLCDRTRPGHFQGVITVLTKLFNIVEPTFTYFGMKDAQQVAVVDLLIQQLNFNIQLRMIPTVREADGLAKSSRNVNLSEAERKQAPLIYQSLKHAETAIINGEADAEKVTAAVATKIKAAGGTIDYIEVLTYPELLPITTINQTVIVAVAIKYQRARLIDNVIVNIVN